ncbi:MAG: hypothetical protein RLY85_2275 [Bacteroidota bacterium]|jgi:hypothetical protein
MIIADINIGPNAAFHMLRHFVEIPEMLRLEMLRSGRTEEAIEKELREPGSRFETEFAQDIEVLLDRILEDGYEEEIGANGNLVWKGWADPNRFPHGAGTQSVVHIDTIPKGSKSLIYKMVNRGVALMHFKVGKLPLTHKYTIILKPTQTRPVFITAFPGAPAMPLPERSMVESLYKQCKAYWDTHLFLVEDDIKTKKDNQ